MSDCTTKPWNDQTSITTTPHSLSTLMFVIVLAGAFKRGANGVGV